MIYAIILIILGLLALVFNKETISQKTALTNACLAPLFMVWGLVGIIILTTARLAVLDANAIYWSLLIVGSTIEILIGGLFIYRYLKLKKGVVPACNLYFYQNLLGVAALVVGIATMLVK